MRAARSRRLIALLVVIGVLVAPVVSAITVTRVTVATTATLIYTPTSGGSSVLIRNAGAASVFLGDATVTTATGWELVAGAAVSLPVDPIYGIVVASTVRVDVLEPRR